ncbi:hypothetical protein [Sphingopyxis granuli]|jgi:hypothetical protein|uniref:Secreted protein n=1 Tax=Sphingopyxis granuli TaxID=267128 RepID=A0AA86GH67_9SPHN|nr:hypothetical protein [Sphingopyxis granuli]AMG72643.1 Putative secreted protein [Sphingopyxis granuli]QUM72768.1 hypothetical protein ICN83_02225 [Sphingopyxis granuli]UNK80018.1 hypothetical protein MNQ96_02655 [Sphingopyxis granuli]
MIRSHRPFAAAALAATLSGCAATAVPRPAAPPTPTVFPPSTPRITQNNNLVGRDADSTIRLFGKPRLDVTEGAGRKLQFAGSACTIDVYYYPPRVGATPVATHVDARTPDGRDTNVDGCIGALRR